MPENLMKEAVARRPSFIANNWAQIRTAADIQSRMESLLVVSLYPEKCPVSETHRANRGILAGAIFPISVSS